MANTVNIFDFAGDDLATFLATPISDGTYADVFNTLKVDATAAAASQIFEYAGQLLSNGVDDFIQASYPYIRTIALGGQRLKETPSPSYGGVPGNWTYTIAPDERVNFDDAGPPVGGDIVTFTMPDITALTAGQEGAEVSFRLEQGNPISAVAVTLAGGNVIVDPQTGADAASLFFLPGTLAAGTIFTWKAVGLPQVRWVLEYDVAGSGGGATGWPSELAVDRTTSGNNPQTTADDEIQFGTGTPKIKQPAMQSRSVSFASGGLSALVNVGAALYVHDPTLSILGRVTVTAEGNARISDGTIAGTDLYPFKIKQEWELSSGGDSIIATHILEGSGVAQLQFGVDVVGIPPTRSIYLKVNEGPNVGRTVDVQAMVITSAVEQEIV